MAQNFENKASKSDVSAVLEWTDDFAKFKKKVESIFGDLEKLAETAPDVYAHMVLSHGFMEYAGIKDVYESIKERIHQEQGSFNYDNPAHDRLFWKYLKAEYTDWAIQNKVPGRLVSIGWKEFRED